MGGRAGASGEHGSGACQEKSRFPAQAYVRRERARRVGGPWRVPGHGFPTDVVSFVNKDQPDKDEDADKDKFRRRSYPSRNLDIAIRDYAPGADIVLDGLVYKSAGVTLNWKRPAGESEVREIQSLKWFWQCRECGAAGTNVIKPDECLSCRSELSPDEAMRFLRPAGSRST